MKQHINPSINIYPRISKVYSFQQTQESPVRAELLHNFSTSTKNMFTHLCIYETYLENENIEKFWRFISRINRYQSNLRCRPITNRLGL